MGRYKWRLYIPVVFQGVSISWTTRTIGDKEPRYLSAPAEWERESIKHHLFGEDRVRHAIVVTEGVFDAMRIGPGAVALCGVGYSREQVARIAKYPTRVICFDSEPAAQRRASKLANELEVFPGQTIIVSGLSGKDPGDTPQDEIDELRKQFLE